VTLTALGVVKKVEKYKATQGREKDNHQLLHAAGPAQQSHTLAHRCVLSWFQTGGS